MFSLSGKWRKFRLLFWKNWLLQYRKPIQTLIEILSPVLFSIILVIVRGLVDPKHYPQQIYQPFCPIPTTPNTPIKLCDIPPPVDPTVNVSVPAFPATQYILYKPVNDDTEKMMEWAKKLKLKTKGFNTTEEIYQFFRRYPNVLYAVDFSDITKGKDVTIKLRPPSELGFTMKKFGEPHDWRTSLLYPLYQLRGPRNYDMNEGGLPSYYKELFLAMQQILTSNLIALQTDMHWAIVLEEFPFIRMKRFPFCKFSEDPLLQALQTFAGMVIMASFTYTCTNLVKMVTNEKEKQLKETMKLMGLPNWLHWVAWFVKSILFLTISMILIALLLKVKWYSNSEFSVLTFSNITLIFVFFTLYVCSIITFSFAISVFFSKANTAATMSAVVWFLTYVPYLILSVQYDALTLPVKLITSLGMNTAMAFGFQIILMFEGSGEGSQWSNLFKPGSPDDTLSLGLICVMLVVDTILYLLIALYVEAVFPGEFGVPKPWNFLFTREFWYGTQNDTALITEINAPHYEDTAFESEPIDLPIGIKISNLRKVFKHNVAVDNLSLNMYENQITVLLGHNGAGKTTTLSMLTGMFPPTTGTAIINGCDIRTDMNGVRSSLGLCPQHNVLFNELTVKEHLYFYSELKETKEEDIPGEIIKYVNLLELEDKADAKSSTLSGGMKRKLSVAIALCGKSKVVMLDEPTAGMDPSARRALWELIESEKQGRTILLTTHFMDEADLLGDRIAIMAAGKLKCCGSSFFLKKKYGSGYNLVMDKKNTCEPRKVRNLLRNFIPGIEIHNNIGSELSFLLPEEKVSVFESMFKALEQNSKLLDINSYGVSLTTLEEVFMAVGADNEGNIRRARSVANLPTIGPSSVGIDDDDRFLKGPALIKNQYKAMFMKRRLWALRSWRLHLIILVTPILMIIATMLLHKIVKLNDQPPLALNLGTYGKQQPIVLIESTNPGNDKYLKRFLALANGWTNKKIKNITTEMLRMTKENPKAVRTRYLTGATFDYSSSKPALTAWFNNDPYHAAPIAHGMILNSVYQEELNTTNKINFIIHPLPYKPMSGIKKLLSPNSMGFNMAFNLGFSMTFVAAFFILFYVRERASKSKHLQFVSGLRVFVYWTTSYICDLIWFFCIIVVMILTMYIFQEEGFHEFDDLARLSVVLLMFAFGSLPLMYAAAYYFHVPSTGFTRLSLFGILFGDMVFLIVCLLTLPVLELEWLSDTLHWIFLVVPHYSLCSGVLNNFKMFAFDSVCSEVVKTCILRFNASDCPERICRKKDFCCPYDKFGWKLPGLLPNIVYTLIVGAILLTLILMADLKIFHQIKRKLNPLPGRKPVDVPNEDSDVADERQKIKQASELDLKRDYTLAILDLTKYYGNFLAVNGVCLGLQPFECFGLLGLNGAGKTTTFKMLTGDTKITYGKAWVQGSCVNDELKDVQRKIGYCPQFDALLNDLTARESMTMFGLLRGVRQEECDKMAVKLARDFDFLKHIDKRVKQMSGGNKRKLSTAIALIGDPPIMYLDEPTTGMDPGTKRFLWNAICDVRDTGKCIVLTSHSMEECEALCTKIAIMVNGNFKCLGSTQHLKSKFADGYTMTIKVKKMQGENSTAHIQAIKSYVESNFRNVRLIEEHQELITYYVMDTKMPWSTMFGILERGKKTLEIEDYSLGQSSLEQVFLSFTRYQREEEDTS